ERKARARLAQRVHGGRANRANRSGGASEGSPAWGFVLGDLVRNVSYPASNLAPLEHARAHPRGAVRLDLCAHERRLPLAVPVQLIEVGEHCLGGAVDFDAVLDHGPASARRQWTIDRRSLPAYGS